jgi:broad specificity phosphatase PhoE
MSNANLSYEELIRSIQPNIDFNALLSSSDRLIILVRHGEIQDADLMRCIGRMDVPLSEKGHTQAHQAGKWLQAHDISFSLWSSPLTRCQQTAKAIQEETGCGPIHTEEDLIEMAAGAWEGMTFAEVKEKYPAEYEARGRNLIHYKTPDGESFYEAGDRFLNGVQKILSREEQDASSRSDEPLVIVAHSGVIRSSLCHLNAWPFDYMICVPQPNAGVTILQANKAASTENGSDPQSPWQLTPTKHIGIPTGTI